MNSTSGTFTEIGDVEIFFLINEHEYRKILYCRIIKTVIIIIIGTIVITLRFDVNALEG